MSAQELDAIIACHDLNQHPFYQAWQKGTLPPSKLAAYAAEYAPFIASIELGWRRLGDHDHAATERDHAGLWTRFREALGPAGDSSCPEARALVDEACRSFLDPVESLGTLYAFEAQQPATARSKLDGLHAHYGLDQVHTAYFRLHADDYGEREDLRRRLIDLAPSDFARARVACERACKAMWSALDGILGSPSAAACAV
jgi:pyrroloquinoline-quinone synthase